MYLDSSYDRRGHETFAAYQTDYDRLANSQYDLMVKQIENQYSLGQADISARLSAAKTAANASVKGASIAANATIKATKIRADTDWRIAELSNATTRYGIDTQAAVDREKIGLAREEMYKIGIPQVLIQAWSAQKQVELERIGLGLKIADLAAQYRSTPDRYWMALDFEAALPYLLNGAGGAAGGGLNGATGAPGGAPTPNSLENLVAQLTGTGAMPGTAPTTGGGTGPLGTNTNDLFGLVQQMTSATTPTTATGTGTTPTAASIGSTAGGSPDAVKNAIMATGMQAIGGLPLEGTIASGDVNGWFQNLAQPWHAGDVIPGTSTPRPGILPDGGYDPLSPQIKAVADAARAAGYDMSFYDEWVKKVHPPADTTTAAAPAAPAAAPTPVAAVPTSPTGMTQQDATLLSGVSATFAAGLDPFVLDKLSPTQRAILLSGGKRLGYDVDSELFRAETRRPGQGNSLLA